MGNTEQLIWSAQAGAYAMLLLISVAVAGFHRTVAASQQLVWLAICFLMNICINGFLRDVSPAISDQAFHTLRVLVGPVGVAISIAWLGSWLDLKRRHGRMHQCLTAIAILSVAAGLLCFLLESGRQFAVSGWVALAAGLATVGICMWAGMLGDKLSWLMAGAGTVLITATGIEYGLATQTLEGHTLRIISATAIVGGAFMVSTLLWVRSHKEYESLLSNMVSTEYDPATRLYNGKTLIQKISHAQNRLKVRAQLGALMAVVVTDLDQLTSHVGSGGVHELLIRAGARVSREAGLINPVGRYFDACFMVLMETVNESAEIDRLAHAIQRSFSRPMDIRGSHGEPQSVTLRVGVGVARLSYQSDISSVLHRAEDAALASTRPGAAMADDGTDDQLQSQHAGINADASWITSA